MYSISEQPDLWKLCLHSYKTQTGQITEWPANAAVSDILESTGLISYQQAGSVPFQGIQNEKHFEKKLHALKECLERYLNESKMLML